MRRAGFCDRLLCNLWISTTGFARNPLNPEHPPDRGEWTGFPVPGHFGQLLEALTVFQQLLVDETLQPEADYQACDCAEYGSEHQLLERWKL